MKKIEYLTVQCINPMSNEILRIKGEMGWEMCGVMSPLVGADYYTYYFKKELIENNVENISHFKD